MSSPGEEDGDPRSPRSRSPAMGVSGLLRDHAKVCVYVCVCVCVCSVWADYISTLEWRGRGAGETGSDVMKRGEGEEGKQEREGKGGSEGGRNQREEYSFKGDNVGGNKGGKVREGGKREREGKIGGNF